MKSPFELHNEAEDKNPSVGCEPKYLVKYQATIAPPHEEKNMIKKDEVGAT